MLRMLHVSRRVEKMDFNRRITAMAMMNIAVWMAATNTTVVGRSDYTVRVDVWGDLVVGFLLLWLYNKCLLTLHGSHAFLYEVFRH